MERNGGFETVDVVRDLVVMEIGREVWVEWEGE